MGHNREKRKRYRHNRERRDTIAEDTNDLRLDMLAPDMAFTGFGELDPATVEPKKKPKMVEGRQELRSNWQDYPECDRPHACNTPHQGFVDRTNRAPGGEADQRRNWRERDPHGNTDRTTPLDVLYARTSESSRYR